MKYYLYHIPGKKIGVTCDIYNRVTEQQGYEDHEFEILEMSEDIDYISKREIELQQEHGYKVDHKLYKNLKPEKNMRINITEQTTTFPCPKNDLKDQLKKNNGLTWETEHGKFQINDYTIHWILDNAKTSMYNEDRCYIYNKAFSRNFPPNYISKENQKQQECCGKCDNEYAYFHLIREWAYARDLYKDGDVKTQYVKLQEEAGELAKAILDKNEFETIDAIGDMVVVLTNLAHLSGTDIEVCIEDAYEAISSRKGKMINGTFVKDE